MNWKNELWPEWKVESEIGAGAYGRVYKIKRQDIGGTYYAALKVIPVPQNNSEIDILRSANMDNHQITDYYHRFASELSREFSMMEKLKGYTNIVSYEDHKIVPHADGIGWDVLIRMELLTPLMQHLNENGCNMQTVIQVGIDICEALIICAKENIMHRDIKPGNIFVSNHGDYKLGDFSIALQKTTAQMEYSPRGTFFYMAPEVYMGKAYDLTIDIYSLGLILYRLLNNGRAPFLPAPPASLTAEMMETANKRRLSGEPLPPPSAASSGVADVILKACAFDPRKRYQTPEAFRDALEQCLSSRDKMRFTRHVAHYVKKAVVALQELDDPTPDLFGREIPIRPDMLSDSRIVPPENHKKGREKSEEKHRMEEFFVPAGDL